MDATVEGRNMIMIMSPLVKKHARGRPRDNDRAPSRDEPAVIQVNGETAETGNNNNAEDSNA